MTDDDILDELRELAGVDKRDVVIDEVDHAPDRVEMSDYSDARWGYVDDE